MLRTVRIVNESFISKITKLNSDLREDGLSILIWIVELCILPVSELFHFVIQNKVEFVPFKEGFNVFPVQLFVFVVRFDLFFNILVDYDGVIQFFN